MFFRRKGKLRNAFDEKLLTQLSRFKEQSQRKKLLLEKSFDPSEEVICETKIAEVKYFFLIREAKQRNVTLKR